MTVPALPFDRVTVVLGGAESRYSVGEFLALPLSERVKSILFGKLTFFANGEPVNTTEALNALRVLGTRS